MSKADALAEVLSSFRETLADIEALIALFDRGGKLPTRHTFICTLLDNSMAIAPRGQGYGLAPYGKEVKHLKIMTRVDAEKMAEHWNANVTSDTLKVEACDFRTALRLQRDNMKNLITQLEGQ